MTVLQKIRQLPQYSAEEYVIRREQFIQLGYDEDNATRLAYWTFVYPDVHMTKLYDYLEKVEA